MRSKNTGARKALETVIHLIFLLCGIVAVGFVLVISVYLIISGLPAIRQIGLFKFLFGQVWDPANTTTGAQYGILPFILTSIYGTAGLDIAIEQPETLGVDLLAADAAAAAEYPLPVVVFDFGTATTVTVVDADRRYRGGVILAGVKLSLHALFSGTAQLPDIALEAPGKVICSVTEDSLQAGAIYGAAAMADGLLDRMEEELGVPCTAVATGGLAGVITPYCRRDIRRDDSLLLRGLALIWRKNCGNR